jgi:hypothetical protein
MKDSFRIVTIGDYGAGDLAFAEVQDRIEASCKEYDVDVHSYEERSVRAFSTVHTAFILAQLARNTKQPSLKKYFVNTAPRFDNKEARTNNEGEGFVYARLKNGVEICAVNSGYSLSFIKDAAVEIRTIDVSKEGSQFRSRDNFPTAFARVISGDRSALGEDIAQHIPDMPQDVIVHSDGYGNLKVYTDVAKLEAAEGQNAFIKLEAPVEGLTGNLPTNSRDAKITHRMFDVEDGKMAYAYKGSSGWDLENGERQSFAEILVRSGSADNAFHYPPIGTRVKWTLAK